MELRIPTTETEIADFINVAKELGRQLKKVEMYCVEEAVEQLANNKEQMVRFSLEKLNEFCANTEYSSYVFTLAMWPIVLSGEWIEKFKTCTDLCEFEQFLHDKQNVDRYYAKPTLLQKESGEIGAFYTFTEECESIFPVKADRFLTMDQIKVDEALVL